MARSRPRWQMTTRSRFAIILGFAGLAVAGVQLAMLSDPPTVLQMVVVAFWSVVGVAYLGSAVAQRVRARRRPAPVSPVATPLEEIVPVPVRPARPRARTGAGTGADDGADARSDRTTRTDTPSRAATRRSPVGAPAATEAVPAAAAVPPVSPVPPAAPVPPVPPAPPMASDTSRVAIRARRTGDTGPRPTPVPGGPATTAATAGPVTPAAPAAPAPAVTARPTPAPVPAVPAVAPVTAASPVPAPVPARPAAPATPRPAPPAPAPEETTDAFTVRAAPTPPRRPPGDQPALSVLAGLDSPLSFGPTRGRTVAAGSGSETRRPRPTPPRGQPHVGVPTPPSLPEPTRDPSGPLPAAAGTRPPAHRGGAHAAAPEGAVPAPRARHRADVEDPVAARRGGGDGDGGIGGGRRARGRHASTEAPSAAARGGR